MSKQNKIPKKVAFLESPTTSGDESSQVTDMTDSPIEEYPQPKTSPYACRSFILLIGKTARPFTIPECYFQPYEHWLPRGTTLKSCNNLRMSDVDEDVGHTLAHYLCTGRYETLEQDPTPGRSRRLTEYRRSVLVYTAAAKYGIGGLKDYAARYMRTFDQEYGDVHIIDILATARGVFPMLKDDRWFREYLKDRLAEAYEFDMCFFVSPTFIDLLGVETSFDTFLVQTSHVICATRVTYLERELNALEEKQLSAAVAEMERSDAAI